MLMNSCLRLSCLAPHYPSPEFGWVWKPAVAWKAGHTQWSFLKAVLSVPGWGKPRVWTDTGFLLTELWLRRRRAGEQTCPRCLRPSLLHPAASAARTDAGKYMVFPALRRSPVTRLSLAFQSETLLFFRQDTRRPGASCRLSLHAGRWCSGRTSIPPWTRGL